MQIRAAVTDGSGQSLVHELLELDEPGSDEVLVRVVSTGLCQTDAHVRRQRIPTPLPLVLGHEGAYTQTELSGPAQATDPRAVPLEKLSPT
jgi:aryl-alcohol dehydrogenase